MAKKKKQNIMPIIPIIKSNFPIRQSLLDEFKIEKRETLSPELEKQVDDCGFYLQTPIQRKNRCRNISQL